MIFLGFIYLAQAYYAVVVASSLALKRNRCTLVAFSLLRDEQKKGREDFLHQLKLQLIVKEIKKKKEGRNLSVLD